MATKHKSNNQKSHVCLFWFTVATLTASHIATAATAKSSFSPLASLQDFSSAVLSKTRQTLNLSNIFGSPTRLPAYERLASQPVFTVTTPWGSPYLLFERTDRTESDLEFDSEDGSSSSSSAATSKQDNTRQVALYFMDEEDAMRLRDEMLQMDQMKGVDMRITASSLSKAVSQSVNLHKGLLTGQPIDEHSGKMKGSDEGGVLRYKIVPPKRELFYAARCRGRERVGLWGSSQEEDARLMMQSIPVIGGTLALKRKSGMDARRRKDKMRRNRGEMGGGGDESTEDAIREKYRHMEGFVGIPVFHCPVMKKYNVVKGLLRNDRRAQVPLYFSYEDLVSSYEAMRKRAKDPSVIPEKPEVEVFNLMDVVTSMDREQWKVKRGKEVQAGGGGIVGKMSGVFKKKGRNGNGGGVSTTTGGGGGGRELEQVVFIPNSKNTKFKERISKIGNSQARGLRPMRPWGRDLM